MSGAAEIYRVSLVESEDVLQPGSYLLADTVLRPQLEVELFEPVPRRSLARALRVSIRDTPVQHIS